MSIDTWLIYLVAATGLSLSPGPNGLLALTHGAVSRRITKLANDIGVRLFEKNGRGLRLTPAGETLNLTLSRFFGELAATVQSLRTTSAGKTALVLSCEPSVAMRWLIPRLGGFQVAHPNLAVHLSVGGGLVDFRKNHVDLAIRRLDFTVPETWNVRTLFPEKVGPVMRPELVSRFEHDDYLALGSKTRPDAWAQWLKTHPSARRPIALQLGDVAPIAFQRVAREPVLQPQGVAELVDHGAGGP
jgi:DNA-binding transcriptional LysR family regulator